MPKTITVDDALEKLRSAGYLVECLKPTPKKPLVIRFYDDLSKPDITVTNGLVDSVMVESLCKKSWLTELSKSMK